MKECPRCGGELRASFSEHTDYPVVEVSEGNCVDIDTSCGDTYSSELIHICCDVCETYWYSVQALLTEEKE